MFLLRKIPKKNLQMFQQQSVLVIVDVLVVVDVKVDLLFQKMIEMITFLNRKGSLHSLSLLILTVFSLAVSIFYIEIKYLI